MELHTTIIGLQFVGTEIVKVKYEEEYVERDVSMATGTKTL